MKRRERTRRLIELGGLVQKAGLAELTDNDRAVLLGAFLAVAAKLRSEKRERAMTLWRRRSKRAFAKDTQSPPANVHQTEPEGNT
ncbi:conjugal transfer protein TraD [Parasphingorhabdus litoris]|uniref:Conjugal transfer protein TraD n=2 Tax=Parasphingorhabdus litoris TaxID=394733 RepID=A0ABP3KB30_9SPHN